MKQMSATQLDEFLQENAQEAILIDVREAHELANGMLENAQHMPMNSIPAHVDELEPVKDSPIVLICRSGQRSAQVGQYEYESLLRIDNESAGYCRSSRISML